MSQPPGQVLTELPGVGDGPAATVISAAREVEQGARSMLLLAPGLFRFDVVPHDDSVQTILRNLSDEPAAEMRYAPVGATAALFDEAGNRATLPVGRFGGRVVLIGSDGGERPVADLLVGSITHLDRGVTGFTAQATLPA